ncbi:DinB family protein [Roseisolibacter sp. H3M3-2]|uniref:DinB family protein n=1 Tax=Roseisolibacter sp. H3M3-2 TaxID=3031323 RepID=UPI0023DA7A7C|nr:DinB family protein [Roseisolibacter sp. H3M3-2]MDF1505536.1 DinB family protein [Roseisolibacter sp. H3M3-2]
MREVLLARWREVGDKTVELAEAVPAAAYDAPTAPGARTFAEALRHLAFWNEHARETLRGHAPDGSANALPAEAYPDRASVLAALRASVGGVADAIAASRDADAEAVVANLAHAAEHYGQLAVYARLAGEAPPAPRSDALAGAA